MDLFQSAARLERLLRLHARCGQRSHQPVALGPQRFAGRQRLVALRGPRAQLGSQALRMLPRLRRLGPRRLRLALGGRRLGPVLAQLAAQPGHLAQGAVPFCLEQLDVAQELPRRLRALLHLGAEALALEPLVARFLGRAAERAQRRVQVGVELRVGFRRLRQLRGQLLRQLRHFQRRRRSLRRTGGYRQRLHGGGADLLIGWRRGGLRGPGGLQQLQPGERFRRSRELQLGQRGGALLRFLARDRFRLAERIVDRLPEPHPRPQLGDVLLEAALHRVASTAPAASLSFTGSPMRARTSSSTDWMSCAPLLSAS